MKPPMDFPMDIPLIVGCKKFRVNETFYFSRYLNLLPKGQMFAVFCLVARGVSALGGSACETAVMVILIQEFRDNLATVIVS